MRALYFEAHGELDQLKLGEQPLPEPGPHQVRVKLRRAALNHLDLWVLRGLPGVPIELPHIPGADGTGVIDALGPGVEELGLGLEVGQEVVFDAGISCGRCEMCLKGEQSLCVSFGVMGEHCNGTLAEQVVVSALSISPKPEHLSWDEAAAFGLTYLTAWRMLINRGRLCPGETVLVHGIGSGVSLACLQLATRIGARVIVTSRSEEKLKRATELGADVALPTGEGVSREVRRLTGKRGVDVVVDSVGRATWAESLKSATKGGRIVTCGATSGPNPPEAIHIIFWNQLEIIGSTMGSREDWRQMVNAVSSWKLQPVVDSVWPLEQGRAAFERIEKAAQFGKIVLACEV